MITQERLANAVSAGKVLSDTLNALATAIARFCAEGGPTALQEIGREVMFMETPELLAARQTLAMEILRISLTSSRNARERRRLSRKRLRLDGRVEA